MENKKLSIPQKINTKTPTNKTEQLCTDLIYTKNQLEKYSFESKITNKILCFYTLSNKQERSFE